MKRKQEKLNELWMKAAVVGGLLASLEIPGSQDYYQNAF